MVIATNLGFPRMGRHRELKKALERFWAKKSDAAELVATARQLRSSLEAPNEAGLAQVPCNDFSLYDHVLDTSVMVGWSQGGSRISRLASIDTSQWPGGWPTRGNARRGGPGNDQVVRHQLPLPCARI